MKRAIELLAPGGDVDSIKAAIIAGANAVYCGLDKFNARNKATNIQLNDLSGILKLAHQYHCQVFITINIVIVDAEIPALFTLLNKLINLQIDGIIVQDLGLLYLLTTYFKGFKVHASTQLTTHNQGQIEFLSKLNVERVNLSRELNINEIKQLTTFAHNKNISSEVFVHGSNCICFSGACYMSSLHGGNSGNRGRCSQPCRDQYFKTDIGKDFPLNLKDNSAYFDLIELADAQVDALKIEGRIKKFHYVYTVVDAWRKQLDSYSKNHKLITDNSALYQVFNRDFSNTFLKGDIHKEMFINNPRDYSAIYLSKQNGEMSAENMEKAKGAIYNERTAIISTVKAKIDQLSIEKTPISIRFSGNLGSTLKITATTSMFDWQIESDVILKDNGTQPLNHETILSRFKTINDTEYYIEKIDLEALSPNLYLPFNALTSLRNKLLFLLNNSREPIPPQEVPILKKQNMELLKPKLSVLINQIEDIPFCNDSEIDLYFQLPSNFKAKFSQFVELFLTNKNLTPWFPTILIGEDFEIGVEFLHRVKPKQIVTNNSGIAMEAYKSGIPWIAGPYLNLVNSFSLIYLKENFNCKGAFISNEISKVQLKGIKKPDDFKLFYRIYHPILLMTSRQCLFHQVTGCEKECIDVTCIPNCEKTATITNIKKKTFILEKSKGNYHAIYNDINYLNIDICNDFPNLFSGFMIDLRDICTETKTKFDKSNLIKLFKSHIDINSDATLKLKQNISQTTDIQYKKGL